MGVQLKKNLVALILTLISTVALAQTENISVRDDVPKVKRLKPKKAVMVDYNSWFETLFLSDTSNTNSKTKASYYGVGVSYDYSVYEKEWGYGFLLGYMQGFGMAGTADGTGYYQKRAPWTAYRAGARIFSRVNGRVDVGLAISSQFRSHKWGTDTGMTPWGIVNPLNGAFIDTRWRIDYKYELVQALGLFAKDTGLVWRIGVGYTIN